MTLRGSSDPRRWAADPANERRWEEVFARLRELALAGGGRDEQLDAALTALAGVASERGTAGGDQTTTVLNTRQVYGQRSQAVVMAEDAFVEWATQVDFDTPFSQPPRVQVTPSGQPGGPVLSGVLENVAQGYFTVRIHAAAPVTQAGFHFLVTGRD